MAVFAWRQVTRRIRREPLFYGLAVLSLALGVGASTAFYRGLDALFVNPIAVKEPSRLMAPHDTWPAGRFNAFRYSLYRLLQAQTDVFEGVAAYSLLGRVSLRVQDETEVVEAGLVTNNYFTLLGVQPQLGRAFDVGESGPGREQVIILSDHFWRTRFGSEVAVLGKTLRVGDLALTVVGVAPAGFRGTDLSRPFEVFLPLALAPHVLPGQRNYFEDSTAGSLPPVPWLGLLARLRQDVSPRRAEVVANVVAAKWIRDRAIRESRSTHVPTHITLVPGSVAAVPLATRRDVLGFMKIASAAVALVLIAACITVVNFVLVRVAHRQGDTAIRQAFGASPGRLVLEMLVENLALALMAGLSGLVIAHWLLQTFTRLELPGGVHVSGLDLGLRPRIFTSAATLVAVTSMVISIACARVASRANLAANLASAIPRIRPGRSLLREWFVRVQVGVSLLLLTASGSLVRSVQSGLATDVGFKSSNLLVAAVDLSLARHTPGEAMALCSTLAQRIEALPGARAASFASSYFGVGGATSTWVVVDGDRKGAPNGVLQNFVGPHYLLASGVELLQGRSLGESDREGAPPVALVNESMAKALWPRGQAIGKRFCPDDRSANEVQVVGVVRDGKYLTLDETQMWCFYVPYAQYLSRVRAPLAILVRSSGPPDSLISGLRREIGHVDPATPVSAIDTMDALIRHQLMPQRLALALFGGLGIVATLLAAFGLFGLVSMEVARQAHEMGVRRALGARKRQVFWLIARRGLLLTLGGILLGLALSLAFTKLLSGLLHGVRPIDTAALGSACLLLLAVGALAICLPACRGAAIEPWTVLRDE